MFSLAPFFKIENKDRNLVQAGRGRIALPSLKKGGRPVMEQLAAPVSAVARPKILTAICFFLRLTEITSRLWHSAVSGLVRALSSPGDARENI